MSFSPKDYDNAFVSKIQDVFSNTRYAFAEWAFKEDSKTTTDSTPQLPMVSLYRLGYLYNRNMYSFPEKMFGRGMWKDTTALTQQNLRTISVTMTYQLDIWGNTREEMDMLTSELLMYFEISPVLYVTPQILQATPANPFRFDIVFEDGPVDNTDIMSMETHGRIYRNTIFYVIPEARLMVASMFNMLNKVEITLTDSENNVLGDYTQQ